MKRVLYKSGVIILLVLTSIQFTGCLTLKYSLKPNKRGQDLPGSYEFMYKNYPHLEAWIDSLNQLKALKDTFMYAPDGARLHAYYVTASQPTSKTAVIVHGYTDNAIRMFMIGYLYSRDLNYNILLPDLRWAGQSDGTHIQMGWLDRLDVMQWLEVANQIYGDSTQMVVHGISMGAATTMMLSGEVLPDYVKCFVEDCGYTSVWDEFKHELKKRFKLPPFPVLNLTSWACGIKYNWKFKEASSMKQLVNCERPMLFIHGEKDDFVPTWMVYKLYEVKPEPKELWVVPGVVHAKSYHDYPYEYTQKVKAFTDKYIR